jgi:hypothetical protein
MISRIFILVLFISLSSCYDWMDAFTVYTINKGDHYSRRNEFRTVPPMFSKESITFKAYFFENCLYNEKFGDINKLYGMTTCGVTGVHNNSARFGWRGEKGIIEIFAYWYINGKRGFKLMGTTVPWKADEYKIYLTKNSVNFVFNGTTHTETRNDCSDLMFIRLLPYFGGDAAAPHEMKISINEQSGI